VTSSVYKAEIERGGMNFFVEGPFAKNFLLSAINSSEPIHFSSSLTQKIALVAAVSSPFQALSFLARRHLIA